MSGIERLAFTGRPTLGPSTPRRSVGWARPAEPVAQDAQGLEFDDARREQQDRLAFKALLAFTIVLFIRPQDQLRFLDPFHLGDVTAIFALVALVAGRLGRGAALTVMPREFVLLLGLAGVMLLTAPFSVWPGGAVGVFVDVYSKVVLVFALMVNTITTRARLERFVGVVVLGTSYIAVRGVFDYARGANLIEDGRLMGAVGGLFGNPNDMALNMVSFLPLTIVVALRRARPLLRLVAFVGIPATAAAIVFSKSRGGTVALVAMVLVLLYQMRRIRPGIAILVVAASLAALPMLPSSFTDRMSSIFNPDEDPTGSREARKRLLREGYQAFLDHPVFGLGAGQFQNYEPERREEAWRETHNAVLQVAAELGIAGLLLFAAIIVCGFAAILTAGRALRRRGRHRPRTADASRGAGPALELYASALIASLTGWFVAAMFASVAYYWTFYLVLGLAVSFREIALRHVAGAAATPGAGRRIAAA